MRAFFIKTKKLISLFIALLFLCIAGCSNAPTSVFPTMSAEDYSPLTEADFLTASGQNIYNANGKKVLLNGVNLGGWLHFEGWMDGGGYYENEFVNHFAVRDYLEYRFTPEEVESLLRVYQQNFVTETDLLYLRYLGLNFVRVPFFWTEILNATTGEVKPNAFDQLDWVIAECKKIGMYVMLDLHGSVGGHSDGCLTGGHLGSNALWTDETCRVWTDNLWTAVATRYKNEPAVLGYDLLNEPMPPEDTPVTTKQIYDRLYKVVRAVDDKHIIITQAFWSFDTLGAPKDNGWENVVYQVHFYEDKDKGIDTQLSLAEHWLGLMIEHKRGWDVPVLAGEYNLWNNASAWKLLLECMNEEGISWCSWTYKNADKTKSNNWGYFYNANVEQVDYYNDSYSEIARKWKGYSTENYERNAFLTDIIRECAVTNKTIKKISPANFTAEAYKTGGTDVITNAFDGDITTRWTNGEVQGANQYITVWLGGRINVDKIRLISFGGDYGKEYSLYYRNLDTGAWTLFENKLGARGITDFNLSGLRTNAVKIYQNGVTENFYWSIREFLVYGEKNG